MEQPGSLSRVGASRRWRIALTTALVATSIVVTMARPALRLVPRLLTERGSPSKSDALVALGGDGGGRIDHAVELWRQGWAPLIVVSGGSVFRETTWASLMKKRALELGVPDASILSQDRSWTTAEDAIYTAKLLRDRGARRAIVVTSSWHSARAIDLFREVEPAIEWISCPTDREWSGDWWQDANLVRAFASELLKRVWPER